MYSFVITGGGTEAIGKMLRRGGASKWFKCAYIPYDTEMTDEFLGYTPDEYVSQPTAYALARRMFLKANCPAIAVTAKLMSPDKPLFYPDGTKRVHKAWICLYAEDRVYTREFILTKETREEQEEELADIIMDVAAGNFIPNEGFIGNVPELIQEVNWSSKPSIIFSGSFNPPTKNHLEMAELVHAKYGIRPVFEISVTNRDKPKIDFAEVLDRAEKVNAAGYGLLFHDAPLFLDKSRLSPQGTMFMTGTDTLYRMNKDHSEEELAEFKKRGNKFIVFERENVPPFLNKIPELCDFVGEYVDDGWSSTKERELCHNQKTTV